MTVPSGTLVVVVDASLATMWLVAEPFSARALQLADQWARSGTDTIAPSFMWAEVTNALHKRVRRGELTLEEAITALTLFENAGINLDAEIEIHRRALTFARRFDRPSSYDAHYLALADMRGCEMWTGDERLYNVVRAQIPWLHWIGAYQPTGS